MNIKSFKFAFDHHKPQYKYIHICIYFCSKRKTRVPTPPARGARSRACAHCPRGTNALPAELEFPPGEREPELHVCTCVYRAKSTCVWPRPLRETGSPPSGVHKLGAESVRRLWGSTKDRVSRPSSSCGFVLAAEELSRFLLLVEEEIITRGEEEEEEDLIINRPELYWTSQELMWVTDQLVWITYYLCPNTIYWLSIMLDVFKTSS